MRAILLCAGMGMRLRPFTTQKHKALLPINGEALIEKTIKYLNSKNIVDITIVVGHCAEQFEYLTDKYNVELRLSKLYQTHNNYSSMQLVTDKLKDAIVLDGDFLLTDDFVERIDITRNQYFFQKITHGLEWALHFDENNRLSGIPHCASEGWGLVGISYWKGNMTKDLELELAKCKPTEYWDDAVCRLMDKYEVYANKVEKGVALEFDSVEDILFYNAMTYEEIVKWALDDSNYEKINDNEFFIIQNEKKYKLLFNNVGVEVYQL